MKIAIDLRSLHTGKLSGIENYILNVVEYLLARDTKNTYTLFYNSYKPVNVEHFHFVNSTVVKTRVPNRLLNASLSFLGRPVFEKLVGDFDCLFLPNFNPFALGAGKKLAVTVHDISPLVTPEFYGAKDRLWHKILKIRQTLQRADIIFAVSEFTKKDIVRHFGINPQKISVVYPGVDKKFFHPGISDARKREVRNIYGLPGKFLLFINTLEPRKNLSGLLEAFEKINSDVHLVIAGKGGFGHKELLERIEKSKKHRKIHYLGYIEEADKPFIISLASALIYPSFYEGFGFQPLEAMSLGVPVVTSQVTSVPEIVGDAAVLINPYNISDIAGAIDSVLTNEALRKQLVEKGFARAKFFDWQKTAEQILSGFESLK